MDKSAKYANLMEPWQKAKGDQSKRYKGRSLKFNSQLTSSTSLIAEFNHK